jgi:hypothetical protein
MKLTRSLSVLFLFASASLVSAQEGAPPKPGPEHMHLAKAEGVWDAVVESHGSEPAKGTSTMKTVLGGFWVAEHFQCDWGGTKFEGHGMTGYDPQKRKYVTTWVDNMSPALSVFEGTYDDKTRTLNMTGDSYDHAGNRVKARTATIHKDANTVVFEMYQTGADNQEAKVMSITYTRQVTPKPAK